MNITTIGVDLAKSVFQVHGIDKRGKAVIQKRLRRSKVLEFFVQLLSVWLFSRYGQHRLRTENIMRILMLSPWKGNQYGQSHGTQG